MGFVWEFRSWEYSPLSDSCPAQPIRVAIVDDHPLLREGLRTSVEAARGLEIVGAADNGQAGLRLVAEHQPQVLLLDLRLPDMSGIDVAYQVSTGFPHTAIIVLTGYDATGYLPTLRQLGVQAVVRKSAAPSEVLRIIRAIAAGETSLSTPHEAELGAARASVDLTKREYEVLRLVARGRRNGEIAAELAVSIKAIEFHVSNLLSKLNARSRTEAVQHAYRLGLIVPEAPDTLDPSEPHIRP